MTSVVDPFSSKHHGLRSVNGGLRVELLSKMTHVRRQYKLFIPEWKGYLMPRRKSIG